MASSRSLGSLTLDLILKMGGFTSAASQAQRQLDSSLNSMKRSVQDFGDSFTSTIKNAAAALGLAFSFDKFISGIKEAIDYTDQMGKAAQKVGESADQFSALNYAASLAEVGTEDLTSGMGKLIKNLALAKNPLSEQAKLISALGIPKEDINDTLKFMEDFSDRFKQLGGDQTAIQAGMQLFGKGFQALIPFLNEGSQAIGDATDEAKQLGVVVGKDDAEAAQQFNDDIIRLKAATQGWFIQISQALLPVLDEWSGDAVDLAKDHEDLGDKTNTLVKSLYALAAIGDLVAGAMKVISASVQTVAIGIGNLLGNLDALNSVEEHPFDATTWKQAFVTVASNGNAAADSISKVWSDATDGMSKDLDAFKKNWDAVAGDLPKALPKQKVTAAADDFISSVYGTPEKNQKDAKSIRDAVNSVLADPTGKGAKDAAAQAEALKNDLRDLAKELNNLNGAANPDQKAWTALQDDLLTIDGLQNKLQKDGLSAAEAQSKVAPLVTAAYAKYATAIAAPMKAAQAYGDALNDQLAAQKAVIDVQLKSMTMGDQETANYKQLAEATAQATKAITDFQKEHQLHPDAMTSQQYDSELKDLKAYWANVIALTKDSQEQVAALQSNFAAGMQKGMKDFIEQQQNLFDQGKQFITNFASGFSDAFVQWATGAESAKKAFGDFIDSLFADALRFVANQAIAKMFAALQGNQSQNVFGAGVGGADSSGGFFSWLAGLFGGGKASGGPVQPGMFYQVNENGPELLSVGGQDYLMMGKQAGRVDPRGVQQTRARGNVNNISVTVAPTSTRKTADQMATATARKLRIVQSRNG
jgi:lambda family phage tail tape measure protein